MAQWVRIFVVKARASQVKALGDCIFDTSALADGERWIPGVHWLVILSKGQSHSGSAVDPVSDNKVGKWEKMSDLLLQPQHVSAHTCVHTSHTNKLITSPLVMVSNTESCNLKIMHTCSQYVNIFFYMRFTWNHICSPFVNRNIISGLNSDTQSLQ